MDDIVFTLEFSDTTARDKANSYLQKGWKLLSVGPVCVDVMYNGQADYEMSYVLGANAEQYAEYQKENSDNAMQDIEDFLNNN